MSTQDRECDYPNCTHKSIVHAEVRIDKDAILEYQGKELKQDLHYAISVCLNHISFVQDFTRDLVLDDINFKSIQTEKINTITGRISGIGKSPNIKEIDPILEK